MSNVTQSEDRYVGPERRRHRVYVTRNSEYHCRDGVCVAVKNKKSGVFIPGHVALGRHIRVGLRFDESGAVSAISQPENPRMGDQVCFSASDAAHSFTDVVTSPLETVERPTKETVKAYPN
jgi:hypothetical protein